MFAYGQTAANAIAVMSYLAADPSRRVASAEIADARSISRALTSKLLTQLAAAGLVRGQPGPHGGYVLAKDPAAICLFDIAALFEQTEPPTVCPFGHGWCGNGEPCPLHDSIHELIDINSNFLQQTRLSVFKGVERRPFQPKPDPATIAL
jgi:Rrf2 family transcriptional regulator, iron-sulfur cluster assembly transcription factor